MKTVKEYFRLSDLIRLMIGTVGLIAVYRYAVTTNIAHGKRHHISHEYLNTKIYKAKQAARQKALVQWMHDNGIGA